MGLSVERIPTLADNYTYLVICDATRQAAVVDAPEAAPVIERVESLGVEVTRVLSTHHHFDHSAANPELALRFGAPVFGHASDESRSCTGGDFPVDSGHTAGKIMRGAPGA